jgi:hypothetical protein
MKARRNVVLMIAAITLPRAIVPLPVGRLLVALYRLGSLRRLGTLRFEQGRGWPYRFCDSLTILDHTLRC